MITLYNADRCPYCVRVRLVLAGKGVEHDVHEIDLSDRDPMLRALNPRDKVPVLVHDDAVLTESAAINEYLEEVFPEPRMMPTDPQGRALVRRLMAAFDDLSDAYYDHRRSRDSLPELHAELGVLDGWLEHRRYLAGDELSLADPGYWPWVARMQRMEIDLAQHPNVSAWKVRLEARPEYAAELELTPVP